MTDASTGDRRAADLEDDDFLTVEQLAELRRVTPAAVRAQLRAGNLAGQQVLQGQRTVWRIPVSAARRYLEKSGGSSVPTPDARVESPTHAPASARLPPEPRPVRRGHAESLEALEAVKSLGALEAEVRRLRRQLSALAGAHRRLLDAVTAELPDDL